MEASGGVPFFQQQLGDQQSAQREEDVHSKRTMDRDVGRVAILTWVKTLSHVVRQHQSDGYGAPSVQDWNPPHPHSYRRDLERTLGSTWDSLPGR